MDRHKRVPTRDFQRVEEVEEASGAPAPSSPSSSKASGAPGPSSPSSSKVDFLKISLRSVHRVHDLLRGPKQILNEYQCWDLSTKLSRAALNIEHLVHVSELDNEPFDLALKNFFRITENAKRLVESCRNANWCQAAALQINNEEAFREILVDAGLCYDEIYEEVREKSSFEIEDLRQSSAFSPATATEVCKDQEKLYKRLMALVLAEPTHWNETLIQRRRLGLHLLERLHAMLEHENSRVGSDLGIERDNFGLNPWGECSSIRGGVFRATWLGMPCAKKVLKMGEWNPTQFQKEATRLPMLNHPNLVKIFHCENDQESHECFLAMELMEGNLQDAIQEQEEIGRKAPFSLPVAVDVMIQIANGMCYLHDQEITHGHLKPANVLIFRLNSPHLQDYLHVKLADFGLLQADVRASGSIKPAIRTTLYGAPEAFSQDGRRFKIDIKSDVYSFAVLASHILTGKKPFEGIPPSRLDEAILSDARPKLPSNCPEELASIIRDCWVKDYRKRPLFVEICCRLQSVRVRLSRGEHPHGFEALQRDLDPSVPTYAFGMCSERSNFRQRNAVARDDMQNSSKKSHIHSSRSSRSMPSTSGDAAGSNSAGPSYRNVSEKVEEVDVSALLNELIKKLSSRRKEVHRDAANTIRCLAKMNSENRVRIAEQGGIPFLINLLRSPDKMTQEHAITALMNLSLQESNRALIMRAGAIDGIVHVVKWGQTTEARENAAATIQCLSYENENKISIGNTGAIPALVELLRGGTRQGRKDAANALCNLVSSQESNKKRAVQTGLISVLMDILQDHSTNELDDISLSILANLSFFRDALVDIANTEPVTMLIDFITCGSRKGQELATALLWKLCTEDPSLIEAAYHSGAPSPLAAVLRDDRTTTRCKRKAKQLLDLLR